MSLTTPPFRFSPKRGQGRCYVPISQKGKARLRTTGRLVQERTWLLGPHTDRIRSLAADKIQRQGDRWWGNKEGVCFSEASTGETADQPLSVSEGPDQLPGLKENVGRRSVCAARAVAVRGLGLAGSGRSLWLERVVRSPCGDSVPTRTFAQVTG